MSSSTSAGGANERAYRPPLLPTEMGHPPIKTPFFEKWSKKEIALTVGLAAAIIIGVIGFAGATAAGNVHLDHSKINLDWFSHQAVKHMPNYAWVDLGAGVLGIASGVGLYLFVNDKGYEFYETAPVKEPVSRPHGDAKEESRKNTRKNGLSLMESVKQMK